MGAPCVSIIVPTYNRLGTLAELAESLSRQTFQDFEVILVNDGGEKVDLIQTLYPHLNITILDLPMNHKHVYARNQGVLQARGEFIMLMDDDDLLVPSHIERMVNEMNDCEFAYSDVEIINYRLENGSRIPIARTLFAYELDLEEMRRFSTYVPSGSLYRRELHEIVGLFDTEVLHYWDWDFFLRVAETHRVKRVPVAGVLYEYSDESSNQSKNFASKRRCLERFGQKHGLGVLANTNFFLLLDEPEVNKRKSESRIVWDGSPVISKLRREPT
ncbi:glycosyltransferase family 2 protein [Ferviditalea candida]|uniref:Glycosyltransferase family 2 protein n=1 Tax=Ferviditalea candida TaxID=3108399 RepID=A0ABU5ZJA6_9BACL|nr:glycosyltransferase family 2 protein [Paenibacillaceae bacterium T2]